MAQVSIKPASVAPIPIALDIGLCLLAIEPIQLTLNQAFTVQTALNAGKRLKLMLEMELGQGPATAAPQLWVSE